MATTKVTLTSSWQQVVPAAKEFFLENPTEFSVLIAFADSSPESDIGHSLYYGFGITRMGATGAVYAKVHPTNVSGAAPYLIVSAEA